MKKFRRYLPWLLIFLGAVLLLSLVMRPAGRQSDPAAKIGSFTSGVKNVATHADSLLAWVLKPENIQDPFRLADQFSFRNRAEAMQATIFITRNDTLLFWSDNRAILPAPGDSMKSGSVIFDGNGYYLVKSDTSGTTACTALILLQSQYFYSNNYLVNTMNEHVCKDCPFTIVSKKTGADTSVTIPGVSEPIHLVYTDQKPSFSATGDVLVVLLLFVALILLASGFYNLVGYIGWMRRRTVLRLIYLMVVPLGLFLVGQWFFALPAYELLSINNPAFFAFSNKVTHLTPILLRAFLLVIAIAYVSHEFLVFAGRKRKHVFSRIALLFVTFVLTTVISCFVISGINAFFLNTSVDFNFENVLTFDFRSVLIFFTLFLLFSAVIMLHHLMISLVSRLKLSFRIWALISLVFLIIAAITAWILAYDVWFVVFVSAYLLVMQFAFSKHMYSNRAVYLMLNMVLAATITTIALNSSITQKQYDRLKLLSLNLASEQDPLTEEFLGDAVPQISADEFLLNNPYRTNKNFDISEYLRRKYFNGYLAQYHVQVTWCRPQEEIRIQPADTNVTCVAFFKDIAFRTGIPTLADEVVFINDGTGRGYYLCTIRLDAPQDTSYLFAELIPSSYEKGLGYPDLLVDVNSGIKTIPANISYARFLNDELASRYGKFNYSNRITEAFRQMADEAVMYSDGYIHFKLNVSDNLTLIISEPERDISALLAPFSYILMFFALLVLVFLITAGKVFGFRLRFAVSFSSRLQWMIVIIILIIFFVAGIISVINLSSLNKNKNEEIVSEKAHSLVIELEHKLSDSEPLTYVDEPYVSELLLKFSQVFFTDLNIYSLDGRLLSTTRPQIFEKKLISGFMNADAYNQLSRKNNSFYLQTEYIGKMAFMSVYQPIRNSNNEVVAYLNLPYFSRETELNREISSFISTFINIYMLIILFTILITVVISNYVTKPLRLIKDKLRNIKLGATNEKIKWKRRDEIGDLVFEYNRMIGELAYKADLLARSEREMAWREMARQVAHEIKNPLTPMKLSTQYLEKAWNDKTGDFDERIKRYTQVMIEQIDSLSDIATAFSHFGKMPESNMVKICMNDVLSGVITLYRSEEYDITLQQPDNALYVNADESQMLRVFNNLLKNAQQAFDPDRRGMIHVFLTSAKGVVKVVIQDNGVGIPEEKTVKIFQPNFTTKSSGTGLGLAMVKNIVTSFGGRIWFESVENEGTTFTVELPQAE